MRSMILALTCGSGWAEEIEPLTPSIRRRGSITAGLAAGGECRQPVQPAKADVPPQWHSLPILPVACRAQSSCLANEWPTNDQWHDRRAWRSCHLPGTSLSGWPDLNRRPLRPERRRASQATGAASSLTCRFIPQHPSASPRFRTGLDARVAHGSAAPGDVGNRSRAPPRPGPRRRASSRLAAVVRASRTPAPGRDRRDPCRGCQFPRSIRARRIAATAGRADLLVIDGHVLDDR